jgi:hypothetical protein
MAETLVLACKVADYNATTGECAAPYYTAPPYPFPDLSLEDGMVISFAIVGIWTLGLIARLIIRASQAESRTH